jgi:5-(carboxyamino)imidazole ribonucleotide mutase
VNRLRGCSGYQPGQHSLFVQTNLNVLTWRLKLANPSKVYDGQHKLEQKENTMGKVIIIMGSKSDLKWCHKIKENLNNLGVDSTLRVASAHKVPIKCYELIKDYEKQGVVFITVAGRSNALSGFTDAQTWCPVIACPPYSDKYAGADVYSSLRMPSFVAPMTVLEPANAALAAAKILALSDEQIQERVKAYQKTAKDVLEKDDLEVCRG